MPMDGLTLGFCARELNALLQNGRVDRVTQPERDMVVLFIRAGGQNHRLLISASPDCTRAHLTTRAYQSPAEAPMFCMLLRKYIQGGRVTGVEQLLGDRLLCFRFESADELGEIAPRTLYFEAMGRHSNLTLVIAGRIIDAIRHVTDDMSRVRQALPGLMYTMPPTQDKLAPEDITKENLIARLEGQAGRVDRVLAAVISGLSGTSAQELCMRVLARENAQMSDIGDLPAFAERLAAFIQKIPSLTPPMLLKNDAGDPVDAFPFPYVSKPSSQQTPFGTLSEALDAYYGDRDRLRRMEHKCQSLKRLIKTHIERNEKKLAALEETLEDSAKMEDYRICGELLTAQLHLVPRGAEVVTLPDYYTGLTRDIALETRFTPAQNAQRYFKRYQKARAALHLAGEQKQKALEELTFLEGAADDLTRCENEDDLADVKNALHAGGFIKRQSAPKGAKRNVQSKPYQYAAPDGTMIYVGKNAVQNERLTQGARGGDLWLHAKNMPGSHVIVACNDGHLTDETLLTAARLAAFNCKARGVNVPIDYTYKKFVKKPSGAPTGFVIYTNQRTLSISVTAQEIKEMQQIVK